MFNVVMRLLLLGLVGGTLGCGGGPAAESRAGPAAGGVAKGPGGAADIGAVPAAVAEEAVEAGGAELEAIPDDDMAGEATDEAADESSDDMAEEAGVDLDDDVAGGGDEDKSLAPFVPTPPEIVEAMLALAEVKPGDKVYDLGCGDGRVLIAAAQKFGATAVGVELDEERCAETAQRVKDLGLADRVVVKHGDLLEEDLSPATVVCIYLMPEANRKLKGRFETMLKPGARVVSHDFLMHGWELSAEKTVEAAETGVEHSLYLYRR